MKTSHIKDLLKKDLLLVELPDEREIIPHDNGIIVIKDSVVQWEIKGSYTLLGKPAEIREEDAEKLVESWESVAKDGTKVFENYLTDVPKKRTATESLLSALESEIFWENPYSIPSSDDINWYRNQTYGDFSERYTRVFEWHEAELRTFDRSRSIILVKN